MRTMVDRENNQRSTSGQQEVFDQKFFIFLHDVVVIVKNLIKSTTLKVVRNKIRPYSYCQM